MYGFFRHENGSIQKRKSAYPKKNARAAAPKRIDPRVKEHKKNHDL